MARTPMVIMWANADGSITLSQRQAAGEIEPTVVASPPRVATLQSSLSEVRSSVSPPAHFNALGFLLITK